MYKIIYIKFYIKYIYDIYTKYIYDNQIYIKYIIKYREKN